MPGKKQAYYIHRPDHSLFAFGGIWEHWMGLDGSELESAAMLTTEPGLPVASIHDRSPVVIQPDFNVSTTSSIASWLIYGGENGIIMIWSKIV